MASFLSFNGTSLLCAYHGTFIQHRLRRGTMLFFPSLIFRSEHQRPLHPPWPSRRPLHLQSSPAPFRRHLLPPPRRSLPRPTPDRIFSPSLNILPIPHPHPLLHRHHLLQTPRISPLHPLILPSPPSPLPLPLSHPTPEIHPLLPPNPTP